MRPDFPGAEFGITSDEAFHLPKLPKSIMVVGGGYIAVEFAEHLRRSGRADERCCIGGANILRGFDDDVRLAPRRRTGLENGASRWCWAARTPRLKNRTTAHCCSTLTSDLTFETEAG
ncbi:FAD-dependent oxidoreductase [Caulobacter segnis]